ncbi:MAG: 3-dehydroquinate synthase [Cyclobacteriaceae bacterium]|nr:3-dehydroquinate synthase [Cyclobacteriaceae bacterium]
MSLPENIQITSDIAGVIKDYFAHNNFSSVMVLVDENTKRHCFPLVEKAMPDHELIEIKSGEEYKNLDTCSQIWSELTRFACDRKAILVNLGGGVIGDMGGFCAATYKRGIRFINIPTTLLAQVDASTGGKLGIDFQGFKNHIGVFQEPHRVFIDPVFLHTLSEREMRSGFAEIIKHCLIADDRMFEKIYGKEISELRMDKLIQHSVEIKNQVVTEDPFEKGLRKILNFGHTVGHAVETFFLSHGEDKMLHGEAIAIGMIAEAYLSHKLANLKHVELEKICRYLLAVYGYRSIPDEAIPAISDLTLHDKKNEKKSINCSLLIKTGQCGFNYKVKKADIQESLRYYNQMVNSSDKVMN